MKKDKVREKLEDKLKQQRHIFSEFWTEAVLDVYDHHNGNAKELNKALEDCAKATARIIRSLKIK